MVGFQSGKVVKSLTTRKASVTGASIVWVSLKVGTGIVLSFDQNVAVSEFDVLAVSQFEASLQDRGVLHDDRMAFLSSRPSRNSTRPIGTS